MEKTMSGLLKKKRGNKLTKDRIRLNLPPPHILRATFFWLSSTFDLQIYIKEKPNEDTFSHSPPELQKK
jgi:hypothetical protein